MLGKIGDWNEVVKIPASEAQVEDVRVEEEVKKSQEDLFWKVWEITCDSPWMGKARGCG